MVPFTASVRSRAGQHAGWAKRRDRTDARRSDSLCARTHARDQASSSVSAGARSPPRAQRGTVRKEGGAHHEVPERILVRAFEPSRAEAQQVGGAYDKGRGAEDPEEGGDVLVRGPEVEDDARDGRVEQFARDLQASRGVS